jgi:hypothetical protein
MTTIFDKLNEANAWYYNLSEHLKVNEITMLFRGRITFRKHIIKKYKWFGMKLYRLCKSKQYK